MFSELQVHNRLATRRQDATGLTIHNDTNDSLGRMDGCGELACRSGVDLVPKTAGLGKVVRSK
jgi:hypothetical protein